MGWNGGSLLRCLQPHRGLNSGPPPNLTRKWGCFWAYDPWPRGPEWAHGTPLKAFSVKWRPSAWGRPARDTSRPGECVTGHVRGGREGEQLSTGRGAQGCGGPTQPAEPWPGSRPVVPCCLPQLGAQTPPGGSATAGWRQPSPLAQVLAEGTPATAATAQSAAGPPSCERLGRTLAPPEGRAAGGEATVLVGGCVRPSADTAPWGEPGHPILTARTEPAPDGPHSGRLAVFLSTLNVGSAERVRALSVSGSLDGMDTQPARPWGATPRLPGGGGRGTQCARSTCFPPRSLFPRSCLKGPRAPLGGGVPHSLGWAGGVLCWEWPLCPLHRWCEAKRPSGLAGHLGVKSPLRGGGRSGEKQGGLRGPLSELRGS